MNKKAISFRMQKERPPEAIPATLSYRVPIVDNLRNVLLIARTDTLKQVYWEFTGRNIYQEPNPVEKMMPE